MFAVYLALGVLMAALVGVVLKVVAIDRQRRRERKGYSHLDHSFFMGITSTVLRKAKDGSLLDWYRENSKKAGHTMWSYSTSQRTTFVVHSPDDLRHAFGTNFVNYVHGRRRDVYKELLGDGIFNSDGEVWREQRRVASHLFTARQQNERMAAVFQRKAHQLCDVLEAGGAKTVDLQTLLYCCTFDAINEIAFGRKVNSLGGDERDIAFQTAFDKANAIAARRFFRPLWKVARALQIGEEKEFREHLRVIEEYIEEACLMKEANENKEDLLTIFENAIGDGERYVSRQGIVLNFLIAGRDTTASALTWTFYELSRHPEVVAKLEKELKEVTSVHDMQYAQAVFQEVLRLHPSVPLDGKVAAKDDRLPSGVNIPKGAVLSFHPVCYTMNPSLYPEPEKFDPSRWLDDNGMCKPYDQWLFPQFNVGPRICLGRHMAALEAKTVLAEVLSRFDVKVAEGYTPLPVFSAVLQMKDGLPACVTPKTSN